MLNSWGKNKINLIYIFIIILIPVLYLTGVFFKPADLLKTTGISFNSPEKINAMYFKQLHAFTALFVLFVLSRWFVSTSYYSKLTGKIREALLNVSLNRISLYIVIFSAVYLIILFFLAVKNYDLGYDEAWYIHWAKNFSASGTAYYLVDGKMAIIDTLTMLPHYLLSAVMFRLGAESVWQFKLFASVLSVITLGFIFYVLQKYWDKATAVISLFLIIIQPGFGFIASSYFGEVLQMLFIFAGLFYWSRYEKTNTAKYLMLTGLMFSAAIHTKFQLFIVLFIVLLVMFAVKKDSKPLTVLLYTAVFTAIIEVLRLAPVLISDPKNLKYLLIMDWLSGNSVTQSLSFLAFEKMQLLNRFYPLLMIAAVLVLAPLYLKSLVEKFLYIFSVVCVLWWVFLFPYTTYRHPFIAIMTISILIGIITVKMYKSYISKNQVSVWLNSSVIAVLFFLMLYGYSSNIIYAYIGYNDGVQFDLDGFKNRLYSPVKNDNSQKEFYRKIKDRVSESDTLYNGSFITQFYLKNPMMSINYMKNTAGINPGKENLLIISRENYPMGFEKIYGELDSAGFKRELLIKEGSNELYKIHK
jgi:hypothetical protein